MTDDTKTFRLSRAGKTFKFVLKGCHLINETIKRLDVELIEPLKVIRVPNFTSIKISPVIFIFLGFLKKGKFTKG